MHRDLFQPIPCHPEVAVPDVPRHAFVPVGARELEQGLDVPDLAVCAAHDELRQRAEVDLPGLTSGEEGDQVKQQFIRMVAASDPHDECVSTQLSRGEEPRDHSLEIFDLELRLVQAMDVVHGDVCCCFENLTFQNATS